MQMIKNKKVRIVAAVLAFVALSCVLIRPRTIYSMAVSAIDRGNYEAAFSFLERTDAPEAEELRKTLCFAPLRSETVYADGTTVVKDYVYNDQSVLLRAETSDPRLGALLVEKYVYDDFGRMLTSEQTQGSADVLHTEKCTYDDRGNLLTSVVSDQTGMVSRTQSTYDDMNRCLTRRTDYATGEWTQLAYTYDDMDQVLTEVKTGSDPLTCYAYAYEYYDVDMIKTRSITTPTETTVTNYDEEGNSVDKVITYPDGKTLYGEYVYRADGLLDKVAYEDGSEVTLVYDDQGNQIEKHENWANGEKTVTLQEFEKKKVVKRTVDENGENRYSYAYQYGKRNLVTFREYHNETTGEWYRYTFTFDRFGNLTGETYEGPEGNYTRTITWHIRYAPHGIPISIQNSAKECKPVKE